MSLIDTKPDTIRPHRGAHSNNEITVTHFTFRLTCGLTGEEAGEPSSAVPSSPCVRRPSGKAISMPMNQMTANRTIAPVILMLQFDQCAGKISGMKEDNGFPVRPNFWATIAQNAGAISL